MIQNGSNLNVIDNTGARNVYCIKVLSGFRRRYASIGDIITVSVKSIRKNKRATTKLKKGEIKKAVIVRTRTPKVFSFNESISFNENSVVLIDKDNKLLGTRIFGAVPKIFKYSKFLRIVSLSAGIIK